MAGDDLTDHGFMHALVVGILVGIPAFAAIAFVGFELAHPAATTATLAWLAAWTGIWAGVFLGGTGAVWLHQVRHRDHHTA